MSTLSTPRTTPTSSTIESVRKTQNVKKLTILVDKMKYVRYKDVETLVGFDEDSVDASELFKPQTFSHSFKNFLKNRKNY